MGISGVGGMSHCPTPPPLFPTPLPNFEQNFSCRKSFFFLSHSKSREQVFLLVYIHSYISCRSLYVNVIRVGVKGAHVKT